MTERNAAVLCRGLVKTFGYGEARTSVLNGVDLRFESGELTLLVGPSGCGKTTLLSIIAGLMSADEGRADVFGVTVTGLSKRELHRVRSRMIGFVFQQHNLLMSLSAMENVAVPLIIAGLAKKEAYRRARESLERLELGAYSSRAPANLSGGQQQRVAIARALVHRPQLVVCDEPTASLDARSGQIVMQWLRDVAVQEDRAVIVVTHDDRIFPFGDRIMRMADGLVSNVEMRTASLGA